MKIIQLYNQQRASFGGEHSVIASTETVLKQHGHQVHLATRSSDNIEGSFIKKISAGLTGIYSPSGIAEVKRLIRTEMYVFDISQTEGKELPALTDVQGDVSGYRERLFEFAQSQGVKLNYFGRIAPAKGLSHGGKITLLSGMQPAEEFSTLVHEIGHEMLHRGGRRTLTTKKVRETEAVAFVVCQSVGLQTGSSSADYIQLWHGDANLLRESLETVEQTAAMILGAIASKPEATQESPTTGSKADVASFRTPPLAESAATDSVSF